MSAAPWMDHAWSHIGLKETPGKRATPAIVEMYAKAGNAGVTSDEVPWCAAFVGACLADAGLPNTGSLLARSYLKYGTPLTEPKVGAIAVMKRGPPPQGHVFFVTGWEAGRIRGIGGNQRNSVSEATFAASEVLGYRWPPQLEPEPVSPSPALAPAGPLRSSLTIAGAIGAVVSWFGGFVLDPVGSTLAIANQFNEMAPIHSMAATLGVDLKAVAMGTFVASVGVVISRRVKAKQEGKAG